MKNSFLLLTICLALIGMLNSCEQEAPTTPPTQQRAQVRFFNAYQDAPVNIRLQTYGETRFLTDRLMPFSSWPEGGYTLLLTRNESGQTDGIDSNEMMLVTWPAMAFAISMFPNTWCTKSATDAQ